MKKSHLISIVLVVLIIINSCKKEPTDNNICKNSANLGISFPPIKNNKEREFTKKQLNILGVTKIRFAEDWVYREPTQGNFDWQPLDDRINWAADNNYKILLTIQSSIPSWSNNNQTDFTNYINLLLHRYPNKISKIQFGNEWHNDYSGSMEEFVIFNNILYTQTKNISPKTKVVLGGITREFSIIKVYCENGQSLDFSDIEFSNGYSEQSILSKIDNTICNSNIKQDVLYVLQNAKYDFIDIHLYDDASNWTKYIDAISDTVPIIVSEFGGPSSVFEKTDQQYQAKRLEKYLNVISNLNIVEAYFFKLVDSDDAYHKNSGLFDKNLDKKLTYNVFYNFVNN